jgi:hypothetical protein
MRVNYSKRRDSSLCLNQILLMKTKELKLALASKFSLQSTVSNVFRKPVVIVAFEPGFNPQPDAEKYREGIDLMLKEDERFKGYVTFLLSLDDFDSILIYETTKQA